MAAGVLALSFLSGCVCDASRLDVRSASVPQIIATTTSTSTTRPARAARSQTRTTVAPVRLQATGDRLAWENLILELWGLHAPSAFRVVRCESGWNPNAVGPQTRYGRAKGLFQIMNGPLDPVANITAAYRMWLKSGWRPWVCRP